MNTNKVLSYVLVALFVGLIFLLVYKACEMKEERARVAKENAEFQQTLRDFGYVQDDTTGSQFSGDENNYSDPAANQTIVNKDGIEEDAPAKPVTTTPSNTNTTKSTASPATKPNPTTTTTTKAVETPKKVISPSLPNYQDGRYRVVAGSFTILDGARREMERLIKMGYQDAEVGKYNHGKYAVVIVKRTNNLQEAYRIAGELQQKGIDATVIDRQRE